MLVNHEMFNTILHGVIHEQKLLLISTFIYTITHHFSKFYISHNGTLMFAHTPRRKNKNLQLFHSH